MRAYERLLSYVKVDKVVLWIKILVACIPAAVVGVLFDEQLEAMFYNYQTVSIALIVFGIAFIVIENRNAHQHSRIHSLRNITIQTALLISVDCSDFPWNITFRCNDCRSFIIRCI